ncbi:MAG: hypothetical protein V7637_5950 [Mycobacteriales bacterium]|jgi:hypothetical protein
MWVGPARRVALHVISRRLMTRGVPPWQPPPPPAGPWWPPPATGPSDGTGPAPAGGGAADAMWPGPPAPADGLTQPMPSNADSVPRGYWQPTGQPGRWSRPHRGPGMWRSSQPFPATGRAGWLRDVALSGLSVAMPAASGRYRRALAAWRDPARRFARSKRRARRMLLLMALVTAGLAWLTAHVAGDVPGIQAAQVFWAACTAVAAVKTAGAGYRVWRLAHTAPPLPAPQPLPRDAAAYPAMRRLDERERVLADLLSHIGPAADDTRGVAADAAAALRRHASRATAVDRARAGAPPTSRAGLDAALGVLVQQLDDGVAGYEALVLAAADAVSASATLQAGDPVLGARLADATDRLAGLAAGLRDVTPSG